MRLSSLLYNFKQGLLNIWRNKMFSLASIATMTACIFLFGVFYSIGINFNSMVKAAEEGVAVTVYFEENCSQDIIDAIGKAIESRPEVLRYKFVSADDAWASFQQEYLGDEHASVAESFADDNPLADAANYEIYLNDVSKQTALVDFLYEQDGVREVHQSEDVARTLTDFNKLISGISVGVIIILIAVAVFLINNTVTVGISVRSEEIAIMKYIGAKDAFVRAPFLVEGVTIGAIGSIIPLVLMYFLYSSIMNYVAGRFSALGSMFTFVPIADVFKVLLPVSMVLGLGIGFIGSRLTIIRHLKV
ncbi:MAG: permease-like cell division protein FtsX [Lachnospiraceae bacterium]|nr:permease-like cell division protein FtsX [Lachnospiraceae bacterium]